MYREIHASTQIAANFAILEHILRVSTSKKEADEVLNTLSEPLRSKITELLRRKQSEGQQPLHELSLKISIRDLERMQDGMIVVSCYNYIDRQLKVTYSEPGAGKFPECFMLKLGRALYLLYTPQMTTLDGYDPFTGNTIFPLLTEEMVQVFSNSLYTTAYGSHLKDKHSVKATPANIEPVQPRLDTITLDSEEESEEYDHEYVEDHIEQDYIEDHYDSHNSKEFSKSEDTEKDGKSPSEHEELTDSELEDISIEQTPPNDPNPSNLHQQKRTKPKVEKWKEVEYRIHEERKKRDMCGSECIVI